MSGCLRITPEALGGVHQDAIKGLLIPPAEIGLHHRSEAGIKLKSPDCPRTLSRREGSNSRAVTWA